VYTRARVVVVVVQGNAKEASVLVRLNCRSGFNVGGLECVIITETCSRALVFGLSLVMPCLLIVENNGVSSIVGDGNGTMDHPLTVSSASL
jgi:hypothetical protein